MASEIMRCWSRSKEEEISRVRLMEILEVGLETMPRMNCPLFKLLPLLRRLKMSSQEQRSSHKRQRKKRLAVACESCRAKKEKCDRNVPGCSNCKRRKTICKWGDERDFHSSEAGSSIHSQPLDVTQDGLSIDMATAYRDTNVTSDTIEEFASLKPNVSGI
jgi:hypothetical protein